MIPTVVSLVDVLAPILIGVILLFLYISSKLLLDAEATLDTNPNRGGHFFEHFFLAPDFIVFSMSLVISSKAIEAVLNSRGVTTHFGDRFSDYFYGLLLFQFIALVLTTVVWHRSARRFKTFPIMQVVEKRSVRGGGEESVQVYRVRIFKGLFSSKIGFWNLVVGNLLGFMSISAYALFVYYAFVSKPPW